jgi:hypothetical protein
MVPPSGVEPPAFASSGRRPYHWGHGGIARRVRGATSACLRTWSRSRTRCLHFGAVACLREQYPGMSSEYGSRTRVARLRAWWPDHWPNSPCVGDPRIERGVSCTQGKRVDRLPRPRSPGGRCPRERGPGGRASHVIHCGRVKCQGPPSSGPAVATGFEPVPPGLGDRRSTSLSHTPMCCALDVKRRPVPIREGGDRALLVACYPPHPARLRSENARPYEAVTQSPSGMGRLVDGMRHRFTGCSSLMWVVL